MFCSSYFFLLVVVVVIPVAVGGATFRLLCGRVCNSCFLPGSGSGCESCGC